MGKTTANETQKPKRSFRERFLSPLAIPLLAIFTSLVIVAIVIIITSLPDLGQGLEKVAIGY